MVSLSKTDVWNGDAFPENILMKMSLMISYQQSADKPFRKIAVHSMQYITLIQ